MAENRFVRMIRRTFTGAPAEQAQAGAEQAPAEAEGGEAAPAAPAEAPAPARSLADDLAPLLEALARQEKQGEALAGRLGATATGIERLLQALTPREQQEERLLEQVRRSIAEGNEDLTDSVRDLAAEAKRQTESLQNIHVALIAYGQTDKQVGQAVGRLAEMLESVNRSNASHVELMEQIRDRLAHANEDLGRTLLDQGRRLSRALNWVLGAMVAILGALLVLLVQMFLD